MPSKIELNPFRDYGLKVCTSVGQISLVWDIPGIRISVFIFVY
jgi:hypothetical protein